MAAVVASEPLAQLGYAAVVDLETWEDVDRIRRPVRLLLAARIGATRLIDNAAASPPAAGASAGSGERGE
jgi:pantothenate synthetase